MTPPSRPSLRSQRPSQMTSLQSMCPRTPSCGRPSSGTPMAWRLATSASSKNAYHLLPVHNFSLQGAL